ncbi:unnamed protein product [Caenorhabditis angaria]|uniref:MARVEL domain-containing protein n=1 Tax=Caenorhabditis angaria TaxID=860376 RepID=A0A9P1IEL1_9PELO|nr:unnamed protein product [Caenorhabditis angaria]
MNNVPMSYKMTPLRDVYYEDEKRTCFGKLSPKSACLLVALFEIVYWMYYGVILLFTIIHQQPAWTIVFTSVNLLMLTAQVAFLWLGAINENPKFLQTHLIFLALTFLWDIVVAAAFFCISVLPIAYTNEVLNYKGNEYNARVFGIVMGSIMIFWFVARFFATVVVYRYWKLLRALHGYGRKDSI